MGKPSNDKTRAVPLSSGAGAVRTHYEVRDAVEPNVIPIKESQSGARVPSSLVGKRKTVSNSVKRGAARRMQ